MKSKKRTVVLTLMAVMLAGSFAGCGKEKVTAESLLAGAYGGDNVESMDADLVMNVDADIDISDLFSDSADQSTETENSETTMNFKVALDCNIKATEKIAYANGNATVDVLGMSQKVPVKSYVDSDNKVSYTYNEDYDLWTKSDLDSDESLGSFAEGKIDKDIFTDLKLADTKEEDSEYVVTGKVTMDNLKKLYGDSFNDLSENTEDIDLSTLKFDVTMKFDKKSKMMKSFECKVDPTTLDAEEYTINEFSAEAKINKINDVDVKIPSEVVKEAIEE